MFSQNNLSQEVVFNYKKVHLKEFLLDVQKKYKIQFSFGNIDLDQVVSSNYQGDLKGGFQKVFSAIDIKYKLIGSTVTLRNAPLLNLRGDLIFTIIDADTKNEIIGATLLILNNKTNNFKGASSDLNGQIWLKNLAIGRYDFKISSIGYEGKIVSQVSINSVKDKFIEVELRPSITNVGEVVIKAKIESFDAMNEMAMNSSRAFSVEETKRYAVSISDPARMAQNYAGVTHSSNDISNDIVIRGNSPRGLLWRLEGVDIPNPNHFGNIGGKGGLVSFLSNSILTNSDFYTSSFPAEHGNALSGVFDLKLRKGNSRKREHSIKIGALGFEASTEGYFSKKSRASYNVNYRFSSLGFINSTVPELKNQELDFQDLALKIYLPLKKLGVFSIFALGGVNTNIEKADTLRENWGSDQVKLDYFERQGMGVFGITHKKVLSEKMQIHTSIATTANYQKWSIDVLTLDTAVKPLRILHTNFNNTNVVFSTKLTHQYSKNHLFQFGLINTFKIYDNFLLLNEKESGFFSNKGTTDLLQNFMQWKYRVNKKLTINSAYHFTYLFLNNTWSIDPRFGLSYKANEKHSINISSGLHSQPEHITTYLIEKQKNGEFILPNFNLRMSKSYHNVLSWDYKFAKDYHLKTEIYYQYLFDIPVEENAISNYSTINSQNIYNIISDFENKLVNKGTGQNYGIDLTLEKSFSKNFYAMFTASLYDSYYTTFSNRPFRTNFANNYLFNILGGKDFVVGKNKNNLIGLNTKAILNGGQRYTPIDLSKSIDLGEEVVFENSINTKQFKPYYRFDLGFSYIINAKYLMHTFQVDIQNISNHKNDKDIHYNKQTKEIDIEKQTGIIPFISYKLDFSFKRKR